VQNESEGGGYSSLSHLRRFPIDILKIDRSFVVDLSADAGDASIVSAVISMGKSLHMVLVA
jgi:EAL domain-containing protein (putative c-di-GMP-specific phosphodiesterase class I)